MRNRPAMFSNTGTGAGQGKPRGLRQPHSCFTSPAAACWSRCSRLPRCYRAAGHPVAASAAAPQPCESASASLLQTCHGTVSCEDQKMDLPSSLSLPCP